MKKRNKNIFMGTMSDEGVEDFFNVEDKTTHAYLTILDLRCRFNSQRHLFIFMVTPNDEEMESFLETYLNGDRKRLVEELILHDTFSVSKNDMEMVNERFKNIIIKKKKKNNTINNRIQMLFE